MLTSTLPEGLKCYSFTRYFLDQLSSRCHTHPKPIHSITVNLGLLIAPATTVTLYLLIYLPIVWKVPQNYKPSKDKNYVYFIWLGITVVLPNKYPQRRLFDGWMDEHILRAAERLGDVNLEAKARL